MVSETIKQHVAAPGSETVEALFEDYDSIFWVDWREDDAILPEYCDSILKTGELKAETAGEKIFVIYKDKRLEVPLTISAKDRHITLLAINKAIQEDFEIRFLRASDGSDTLAFAPLSNGDWEKLETQHGKEAVDLAFMRLDDSYNVFTDPLVKVSVDKAPWWKFWK